MTARQTIIESLCACLYELRRLARQHGDGPLSKGLAADADEIERVLNGIQSGRILVIEGVCDIAPPARRPTAFLRLNTVAHSYFICNHMRGEMGRRTYTMVE
jgi:hypothetical protein